jgi:hypothetical protein
MSEAVFRLAYNGEAVSDGEMDVADLAPALIGVSQLLKAAGRVVDGDGADIRVRVKSTRDACFEVLLNVIVPDATAAWALWKTPDVQAAATLLSLVGITGIGTVGGAIGLVRRMKGRQPSRLIAASPGNVAIEIDGDRFEVPDMVARIAMDAGVRAALERVVSEPLERDGIETVEIGGGGTTATIEKSEAPYFRALPLGAPDEFVSRHTKAFSIVTLSFKTGQKWRLSDGASPRLVAMSDANFIARVESSQEAFAKGDILVCEVVETSRRTTTGFKSDYEIVRVIEHRRAFKDTPLFESPSDASPTGGAPSA